MAHSVPIEVRRGKMVFKLGGNLLEACILAIIEKEDVSGDSLTQEAKELREVSE